MEIKIFYDLLPRLANKVKQFELENFYTEEGEKTPERLAENEEKYFSPPKAWLLVLEEGKIIGRVLLHKRRVKFNSKDIILGGIGGVCTHKGKRRQGIATMMLKEAMRVLQNWGCNVAFLCTNVEKTGFLYSLVGFAALGRPYTFYGRSGKLYEDSHGMIAPVNSKDLFGEILNSKQKLHLGVGNW